MGKGCIAATKYFLFLFNLIFFIFGAVIMGFGLWILLDNQSLIAVLQESSFVLKVVSYVLIGVGSFTMLLGFLGCLGAIYEIRCLLGLYFTCLLLILLAQVAVAIYIFIQRDSLKVEANKVVPRILKNYPGQNKTAEQAWDYLQRTMQCCGWQGRKDWEDNIMINNSSVEIYPCSCYNTSLPQDFLQVIERGDSGFCKTSTNDWPIYNTGCMENVESWLFTNYGIILGICLGVAVIEVLGMILSMGLCKSVHQEEYTKVPKY